MVVSFKFCPRSGDFVKKICLQFLNKNQLVDQRSLRGEGGGEGGEGVVIGQTSR